MAGIAAFGAAVGGLAKGYMEGEKHRSDMEDAEARRGLIKLQSEEANLKLGEARREKAYRDERQKLYESMAEDAPAPTAAPAAGIATPGAVVENPAAGSAAPAAASSEIRPGSVPPSNSLAKMEQVIARSQALDLKYGKINPMDALEGMKRFKMYQDEGVIDGLRYFQQTGDTAGTIQRINATGKFQMPEGSKFEVKDEEIIPGSGMKAPNVYAVSPDGSRSLNYRDLLRSSLNPKDALSMDNDVGYKLADLSLKKTAEQNLNDYRQKMADNDATKTQALLEHYRSQDMLASQQKLALAEQMKDVNAARAMKLRIEASDKALDSIMQQFGVSKELSGDKFDMLGDKQKEKIRNDLGMSVAAHTLWKLNLSADGKEGINTQEAILLTKNAGKIKADSIERDDDGAYFFKYGNKKVFVPAMIGDQPTQAAQPGAPAQPGRPGGIQTPAAAPVQAPTMAQTQGQFRSAQQFLTEAKGRAAADPDLQSLQARQQAAIKAGRSVEANNFLAQRNQLLRDRYNLTPLGGVADPSKLTQQ